MLRNAISAAVALALTAAPIAAQAAPQELLRADAEVGESENLRGTTTLYLVVATMLGVLLLISWDDLFDDEEPDSP